MRRAPAQYYCVFPAKGRDLLRAMIAIDHSRYVLVALRHGAKIRGEARLVLVLLPRCGFPVVCYSQQFSRALSQNKKTEELVRTERLPLQSIRCTCRSIYALLPLLSASRSRLCRPGPGRGRALHCECCMLAVRERSCAGKAATRYGLGSRLTVAGRHFSIFSRSCQLLTRMIASSSSLSSSLFCQFYPSASAGVAHPNWGQRLVDVLVRAKFFLLLWCSSQVAWLIPSRLLVLRGCSSETVSPCAAVSACGIEFDAVPANITLQAECQSLADPESIFDWKEGAAALRFAGCWGWMMLRRAFRLSGGTRSWRPTWR